jgi:hypothetical protein
MYMSDGAGSGGGGARCVISQTGCSQKFPEQHKLTARKHEACE